MEENFNVIKNMENKLQELVRESGLGKPALSQYRPFS